jgi:hypothetical protein
VRGGAVDGEGASRVLADGIGADWLKEGSGAACGSGTIEDAARGGEDAGETAGVGARARRRRTIVAPARRPVPKAPVNASRLLLRRAVGIVPLSRLGGSVRVSSRTSCRAARAIRCLRASSVVPASPFTQVSTCRVDARSPCSRAASSRASAMSAAVGNLLSRGRSRERATTLATDAGIDGTKVRTSGISNVVSR